MGDATGPSPLDIATGAIPIETSISSIPELNLTQVLTLILIEMRVQSQQLQDGLNLKDMSYDLEVMRNDIRNDLALLDNSLGSIS